MLSDNRVGLVVMSACDKESAFILEGMEPFEGMVGPIETIDAVRADVQMSACGAQIMAFAVGHDDKDGQMAAVIEEAVQFDGAFLLAEASPVEGG